MSPALARAEVFAARFGVRLLVLTAPMTGASPVALAAAVADAGGMGALGALPMEPPAIAEWVAADRRGGERPLRINLWIPDSPLPRDAAHEAALRTFLARHGPPGPVEAGDTCPPDFASQRRALPAAAPGAPEPAPYPVQRGLTAPRRKTAEEAGDLQHLQAWACQAAALARAESPAATLPRLWRQARHLLAGDAPEAT